MRATVFDYGWLTYDDERSAPSSIVRLSKTE